MSLGVDHFLTKPYHPEDLLAHIRQEIEGRIVEAGEPGPPRLASRRVLRHPLLDTSKACGLSRSLAIVRSIH